MIIKFWVQIDKDTQLERFNERQNTPEKQWKITDEDWRNRDKWDAYETAVNEMIQKTSTSYAPWHILESVDKKYARIKALKIVVEELEKVLGERIILSQLSFQLINMFEFNDHHAKTDCKGQKVGNRSCIKYAHNAEKMR